MFEFSSWSPEAVVGVTLMSLLLVIIVVVLAMCIQAGLFHTININTTKPEFGELVVMYKSGRGAYSESGSMFTECHSLLQDYNTVGVYYDDPEKKSSENLRYIVGLVVSEGGSAVNSEHIELLQAHGYQRTVFPAVKHAVVTEFPYHSTLSCIFAVFRVYPALREYVERRELCAHPIVELYDNTNKRILFTGPLEQQDSFYVPDVLEENVMSSPGEEESCEEEDEASMGLRQKRRAQEMEEDDEEEQHEIELSEQAAAPAAEEDHITWEKSASLLAEGSDLPEEASGVPQGSAEESDTNTGSSFEEIDPSETATLPCDPDTAALPTTAGHATPPPTAKEATPDPPSPQQEDSSSPLEEARPAAEADSDAAPVACAAGDAEKQM